MNESSRSLVADGVPTGVRDFFGRGVPPWIDTKTRGLRDDRVGVVGCGINFNRSSCRCRPVRLLEEIEADISAIGVDIVRMLREVTGRQAAG